MQKGGALSPNKAVPTGIYPDPVARDAGVTLQNARVIRFDASDLMPEAMNNAFWRGILDFVNSPGDLERILADLDKTQTDAYKR